MKKILALLLALVMLFGVLAGCTAKSTDATDSSDQAAQDGDHPNHHTQPPFHAVLTRAFIRFRALAKRYRNPWAASTPGPDVSRRGPPAAGRPLPDTARLPTRGTDHRSPPHFK